MPRFFKNYLCNELSSLKVLFENYFFVFGLDILDGLDKHVTRKIGFRRKIDFQKFLIQETNIQKKKLVDKKTLNYKN